MDAKTVKRPFDYSKWDKIDLSDDEDDFHPNIDNASFIRYDIETD